jgi:hypothetical protein
MDMIARTPRRLIGIALFIALFVLSLLSCDKSESFRNEKKVEGNISFIDILNARSLIIANTGDGAQKKSGGDEPAGPGTSLFKVTESGVFQEIKYYRVDTIVIETETGIEIELDSVEMTTIIYPVAVFDVSEDYLIACFEEEKEGDPSHPYQYNFLARKSDGALFDLPGRRPTIESTYWAYGKMFGNEDGSHLIQRDAQGNVYYLGYWIIYKLNIQNPENITFEQLTMETQSGEGVANFRVNGQGHIMYNTGGITVASSSRLRYDSGRLQYPEKPLIPYWVGFDDKFYTAQKMSYQAGNPGFPVIERIILDNEEQAYEPVGTVNHPDAGYTSLTGSYMFKMKNHNKIIALDFHDDMEEAGAVVAEVYNNQMNVRSFGLAELGITTVRNGAGSDNYYYLTGLDGNQPVIVKVDPSVFPHKAEYLVPKGELDIYKMVVSADDVMTFHALRMSNGRIILGEISPGGVITELEEIGNEVMQVVRIN